MEPTEVIQKIQSVLPDANITVEGEDCNFTARVISESFQGMRPVARQQQVLAPFSELLASGELHALSVSAHTPTEWRQQQQAGLVTLGGAS